MTDTQKIALEFARKCLDWPEATNQYGMICRQSGTSERFDPSSWDKVWPLVSGFLGTRYWIQMNRDRSTNARWYIRIGVQDVSQRGASRDTVEILGDDQTRSLMEVCIKAAGTLKLGDI